jgi:hypothetical protein
VHISWFGLKNKVDGFSRFGLKIGGFGFPSLGLKTSSYDLGLKTTMMVSWFGPQNQVGYGLSVVLQNR